MKGEILIINFEEDKAYLTEEKVLSLKQLELPDIANRFVSPASWTIRVLNYNSTEKRIFAEILSYETFAQPFPNHQRFSIDELNSVQKIGFKNIDTYALLYTLKGGGSKTISPVKDKIPFRGERLQNITKPLLIKREPTLQTIKETFFVPLKNVRFKFGGVSFDKRISQIGRTIEFVVSNENIREEFDAVKNYFGNVLKTKKIQFNVLISLSDDKIINIDTKSPEIDRINNNLIESVKFEFVRSITMKKVKTEIDKSLFTMDEFFDTLTDKQVKADVFYDDENNLFEDLLQITNTKHYKHLSYLSSKHAHSIMKLHFVIRPFSFIFLIEGENKYHIVWETLDTAEATYIWHEEKELEQLKKAVKKINDIINTIKVQGKTAYINSAVDNFRRIYHNYSELVDGFVKWKGEIESVLI